MEIILENHKHLLDMAMPGDDDFYYRSDVQLLPEVVKWLVDNVTCKIISYSNPYAGSSDIAISFETEEDLLLFKMRWL